jgi:hypothetical protein
MARRSAALNFGISFPNSVSNQTNLVRKIRGTHNRDWSRGSDWLWLHGTGFEYRQGQGTFPISSSLALRPAQSPAQLVPTLLPGGVKRPGSKVDHLPPSGAEVTNEWSCTSTLSIRLYTFDRNNFAFYCGDYNNCWLLCDAVCCG